MYIITKYTTGLYDSSRPVSPADVLDAADTATEARNIVAEHIMITLSDMRRKLLPGDRQHAYLSMAIESTENPDDPSSMTSIKIARVSGRRLVGYTTYKISPVGRTKNTNSDLVHLVKDYAK